MYFLYHFNNFFLIIHPSPSHSRTFVLICTIINSLRYNKTDSNGTSCPLFKKCLFPLYSSARKEMVDNLPRRSPDLNRISRADSLAVHMVFIMAAYWRMVNRSSFHDYIIGIFLWLIHKINMRCHKLNRQNQ